MSNENKISTSSVFSLVSNLQRILLYVTLFLIPWFVIPLPYDSTEKVKSVLFIVLSSLLLLLEVVKWIWDGKVSLVKSSLDKIFLLLFGSFFVSFIFARDMWISFWGYDGRMGRGFFVIIFLFLFFYFARSVLRKKSEIIRSVEALSLGLLILIIISLLSVLKIDVFGWIPYVKHFFVPGLPLTFSFQEIMLLSGSTIFINIFLIVNHALEEKYQSTIFPIVVLISSFVAMPIFSINQGALVPILFLVVAILVSLILLLNLNKSLKVIPGLVLLLSILATVFSIAFQYESFRTSVFGEAFTTVNPIRLGADISWVVASSSIVGDFLRGLIGLGNDSFAIAYSAFKPASDVTVSLGNTTFITGSNEIFTILANRGLLGVIVWILLGFTILKFFVKDITAGKSKMNILSSILGLNLLFLFLGSLFLPFSFLTYFVLFVAALFLIVFTNKEENKEEFLLKFWAVNTGSISKDMNKTMENINWFFTILVTLVTTVGLVLLMVKMASVGYVLRAEAYNTEENLKYLDYEEEIPFEVREDYLTRMANYYDQALRYDNSDPYVNRKASLISLEILNLLSEQHATASEDEKKVLISEISIWKNTAIDLSRKAIATSPMTYSNWNARASVYLGLVGVGFLDYTEDALLALQNCVNLSPLDFDSYYKAGQIFMIKEDYDQALASFNRVLNINGQHVPSLILAARILSENGDTENAIAYLEAAKRIMELNELDSGEIYESIVDGLVELGADPDVAEEIIEDVENLEEEVVVEED